MSFCLSYFEEWLKEIDLCVTSYLYPRNTESHKCKSSLTLWSKSPLSFPLLRVLAYPLMSLTWLPSRANPRAQYWVSEGTPPPRLTLTIHPSSHPSICPPSAGIESPPSKYLHLVALQPGMETHTKNIFQLHLFSATYCIQVKHITVTFTGKKQIDKG